MLIDQQLVNAGLARTARHPGANILVDAWLDTPPNQRAARALASGDAMTAVGHGPGWDQLAEGDVMGALGVARNGPEAGSAPMRLLEAEALIVAGGIVAGLERLGELHDEAEPTASIALARHRHRLGDHAGAEAVAQAVPMHAQAALVGARAALMRQSPAGAFAFIEPFLTGVAPLPDPIAAGAVAVIAASTMARAGLKARLGRFAEDLLGTATLPPEMAPTVARVAWTAGLAARAWEHFDGQEPWPCAARLELALLAGDAARAAQLMSQAGALGLPSAVPMLLLHGALDEQASMTLAEQAFGAGAKVHVWRTHPHRWQPWIDAARATEADIGVFDLSRGEVPPPEEIPYSVFDDSSLAGVLAPIPVSPRRRQGRDVWISEGLCTGVALHADWPAEETEAIRQGASVTGRAEEAAVLVTAGEDAFQEAAAGRPMVVVAPPGDPFWAGPLPERVWPAMRVVRIDSRQGWTGAGQRVAEAARSLLEEDAQASEPAPPKADPPATAGSSRPSEDS